MTSSMYDRILRINCETKETHLYPLPEDTRMYIGGMGYGTKILVDEVEPETDPLSPSNKIILTVGPLTGTSAPMHPQSCIVTKSPLTGTILNCYAGGFLGAEIKFCGIDGIILEECSKEWSIVLVENGKVTFHDASPVTGKSTGETENYMKHLFGGDVRTLSIGGAGERLVSMASIFSETRTFGRGGAGAVLGSKKIKGIAFRGSMPVDVAHRGLFQQLTARNMDVIKNACEEEYNLVGMFSRVGTGSGVGLINSRGALATKNHSYGSFEEGTKIDGYAYAGRFYTRPVACYGCPVHCGMLHKYKTTDGRDSWLRGPEYETMFSLGSDVMNNDPVVLAEANQLCEDFGMDTLTTGVTIAWALEMAENGLLSEPGLPLQFGSSGSILGLLTKIGMREGIGDFLAMGPKMAAEAIGKGGLGRAMQVKNSGFAAWMPRRMKGTALAFATSNRGACHKRAPIGAEITGQVDMDTIEGKAAMVKGIQDMVNAVFTLVSCRFHEFVTDHEMYPRYVYAATGRDMDLESFKATGERIWNLERIFNTAAGFRRSDDCLPEKCYEPIQGKNSEQAVMGREQFETMLDEYYSLRGWSEDGVPELPVLKRLGIAGYGKLLP